MITFDWFKIPLIILIFYYTLTFLQHERYILWGKVCHCLVYTITKFESCRCHFWILIELNRALLVCFVSSSLNFTLIHTSLSLRSTDHIFTFSVPFWSLIVLILVSMKWLLILICKVRARIKLTTLQIHLVL